eukprot:571549-Prymnesium_polylepis.1
MGGGLMRACRWRKAQSDSDGRLGGGQANAVGGVGLQSYIRRLDTCRAPPLTKARLLASTEYSTVTLEPPLTRIAPPN